MSSNVAIVLATYNGAKHLEEQLRSLQAQDFRDWVLFARDDGSTDGTPELLAAFAREDARVRVLRSDRRLGPIGNFGALLEHAYAAGAGYVFTCDQDDVWRREKVSRQLSAMARLEAEHGRGAPLLVHSDLEVVDEALGVIHPSFLRFQGIAHEERGALEVLLVQNFVTGCASLLNRPLLALGLPLPERCLMHDWWLAQCAAAAGRIGFIPEPLVRYRQHGGNAVGALGALGGLNPLSARGRRQLARSWYAAAQTLEQAEALAERLRRDGRESPAVLQLVRAYSRIDRLPVAARVATLRRAGIHRHRPLGTALLYARTLLMRRPRVDGREP